MPDDLQRLLRRLVLATVALYLALATVGFYLYVDGVRRRDAIADVALQTNHALCALRHDLEVRVASSEAFLAANPEGVPGIPAALIRDGVKNQRSTIEALGDLRCRG